MNYDVECPGCGKVGDVNSFDGEMLDDLCVCNCGGIFDPLDNMADNQKKGGE